MRARDKSMSALRNHVLLAVPNLQATDTDSYPIWFPKVKMRNCQGSRTRRTCKGRRNTNEAVPFVERTHSNSLVTFGDQHPVSEKRKPSRYLVSV